MSSLRRFLAPVIALVLATAGAPAEPPATPPAPIDRGAARRDAVVNASPTSQEAAGDFTAGLVPLGMGTNTRNALRARLRYADAIQIVPLSLEGAARAYENAALAQVIDVARFSDPEKKAREAADGPAAIRRGRPAQAGAPPQLFCETALLECEAVFKGGLKPGDRVLLSLPVQEPEGSFHKGQRVVAFFQCWPTKNAAGRYYGGGINGACWRVAVEKPDAKWFAEKLGEYVAGIVREESGPSPWMVTSSGVGMRLEAPKEVNRNKAIRLSLGVKNFADWSWSVNVDRNVDNLPNRTRALKVIVAPVEAIGKWKDAPAQVLGERTAKALPMNTVPPEEVLYRSQLPEVGIAVDNQRQPQAVPGAVVRLAPREDWSGSVELRPSGVDDEYVVYVNEHQDLGNKKAPRVKLSPGRYLIFVGSGDDYHHYLGNGASLRYSDYHFSGPQTHTIIEIPVTPPPRPHPGGIDAP